MWSFIKVLDFHLYCIHIVYNCIQIEYGAVMLKTLFGSQIRVDLLNFFLMHPEEEFYVRQLITDLNANPRAVNRELNNLYDLGVITKRISGKQHYFAINQKHVIYNELRDMFVKTVGVKDVFAKELTPFREKIDFCFIYGSFAKGTFNGESDIDILVIGAVRSRQLSAVFSETSSKLRREINFGVFPLAELEKRLRTEDHFFTTILKEPMLFIIGQEDEFRRLAEEWLAQTASNQS